MTWDARFGFATTPSEIVVGLSLTAKRATVTGGGAGVGARSPAALCDARGSTPEAAVAAVRRWGETGRRAPPPRSTRRPPDVTVGRPPTAHAGHGLRRDARRLERATTGATWHAARSPAWRRARSQRPARVRERPTAWR